MEKEALHFSLQISLDLLGKNIWLQTYDVTVMITAFNNQTSFLLTARVFGKTADKYTMEERD